MPGCDERFLCDEMLARLGRWLRAAGYDVVIASPGEQDRVLLQQAISEDRLFITRDQKLLEHRGTEGRVVLLEGNRLADQFRELSWVCDIDWMCHPFSRCLECNGELVEAEASLRSRVPPQSLRDDEPLLYCPRCDKPYWFGSHARRMRYKLEQLAQGNWEAGVEEDEINDGMDK